MYFRIVLGFVSTFFTSKYSFSSGVGYAMRPILLIMWTAFQSFILRHNNNDDVNNNINNKKIVKFQKRKCKRDSRPVEGTFTFIFGGRKKSKHVQG